MKSYSIVVATFVFAAGACCPQTSLKAEAQATLDSAASPKTELTPSAAASGGSGQSSATATAILPPKATVPAAAPSSPLTPGIHLVAEFDRSLNAKKLKPGDKIKAQITQDVILHGKIVVPAESKLLGHVTEAKAATDGDPSSRLGIVFDKILLKHHQELNFVGVIQALAPPSARRSRVDEPDQMLPPSMMGGGGGGQQNNSPLQPPGARGGPPVRNNSGNGASSISSAMASSLPGTAPVRVKSNPGTDPGDVASVQAKGGAKPISAGLPQGVFGIPKLTLSATPSAATPGPVILSNSGSIKLDYATQVLLRVEGPPAPAH